jgi:hypothetical protein
MDIENVVGDSLASHIRKTLIEEMLIRGSDSDPVNGLGDGF